MILTLDKIVQKLKNNTNGDWGIILTPNEVNVLLYHLGNYKKIKEVH